MSKPRQVYAILFGRKCLDMPTGKEIRGHEAFQAQVLTCQFSHCTIGTSHPLTRLIKTLQSRQTLGR